MNEFVKALQDRLNSAANFESGERLMRITLECGHFRLMQFWDCAVGGIGWSTSCGICEEQTGKQTTRKIVNQEETGVI